MMAEQAAPTALPPVLQGRYRIGPVIGRGGAATVYRARDLLLGRDVAIKAFTIPAASTAELRIQEGEARMLGGLNHPALVTLLDAGVDLTDVTVPRMFLVMEYLPNADLRERLRQGPLTAVEVTYLGWDLLGALEYVHEHGIIHRDLKPANVLLTEGRGRPAGGKLADFGIAVLRAAAHQPSDETTGTAAYLSPEQVEGAPLTPATDIYSLGLVLLEAATGHVAFPGNVLDSALARLDRDPPIPVALPAGLADCLRTMTAREPDSRPSAATLVTKFRELIIEQLGGGLPQARDAESERLAAVRDFNLLDTPPDAEFDRITALAARVFDVPIAVVSVVGEDRIWLKSRHGIDTAEVARSTGLGATGGLHHQTLIIEDTHNDPRTAHLPGATESPYRFYAGVPLITPEGQNLGTLAIADTQPRPTTSSEAATLEDLAAMTLHEMELRRAARRIAMNSLQTRT